MIIWSGLGFLVPLIAAVCWGLAQSVVNSVSSDTNYFDTHGWTKLVALLVAGGLVSSLGWWLQRRPGRSLVDKATGEEVILKRNNSLFFVPILYWGPILGIIGLFSLFSR